MGFFDYFQKTKQKKAKSKPPQKTQAQNEQEQFQEEQEQPLGEKDKIYNQQGNISLDAAEREYQGALSTRKRLDEQDNDNRSIIKVGYGPENYSQLTERDKIYTDLLESFYEQYKDRQSQKEKAKWQFYSDLMSLFYGVVFFLLLIIVLLVLAGRNGGAGTNFIPAVITATISILTTLIALPTIIAKYLFNPNEDKDVTNLILKMQALDLENRKSFLIPDNEVRNQNGDEPKP